MNHPNVAQVLGASMDKGHLMIIMDYYPGGNLREYLDTNQLSWNIRLEFALVIYLLSLASVCLVYLHSKTQGIARGMRYIHSRNIVHRDLKTRNILLDSNNAIRVSL